MTSSSPQSTPQCCVENVSQNKIDAFFEKNILWVKGSLPPDTPAAAVVDITHDDDAPAGRFIIIIYINKIRCLTLFILVFLRLLGTAAEPTSVNFHVPLNQLELEGDLYDRLKSTLYTKSASMQQSCCISLPNDKTLEVMAFSYPSTNSVVNTLKRRARYDYVTKDFDECILLKRYEQMGAVTSCLKVNGMTVRRVFLKNVAMHRYDEKDNVIETIAVGPLLTTLCKDSKVLFGVKTTHSNQLQVWDIDQIKPYYISLTSSCDVEEMERLALDHFKRYNLIYDPNARQLRDTRNPSNPKASAGSEVRCRAIAEMWRVIPGMKSENTIPSDSPELSSRANRSQITPFEPPDWRPSSAKASNKTPKVPEAVKTSKKPVGRPPKQKQGGTSKAPTGAGVIKTSTTKTTAPAAASPIIQVNLETNRGGQQQGFAQYDALSESLEYRRKANEEDMKQQQGLAALSEDQKRNDHGRTVDFMNLMSSHTQMMLTHSSLGISSSSGGGVHCDSHLPAAAHDTTLPRLSLAAKIAFMILEVGCEEDIEEYYTNDQKCRCILDKLGDNELKSSCAYLTGKKIIDHMYDYFTNED
jgi:hypothetical protein